MNIKVQLKVSNLNIRISLHLRSLVNAHAKEESVPAAHWIREAIIEKLLSEGQPLTHILQLDKLPHKTPTITTSLLD